MKEANLKWPQTVRFRLCDILEKATLWRQQKHRGMEARAGGRAGWADRARRKLRAVNSSERRCNGRYRSSHGGRNPPRTAPRGGLNGDAGSGRSGRARCTRPWRRRTALLRVPAEGTGGREQGGYETALSSVQLCCEPKVLYKIKSVFKINLLLNSVLITNIEKTFS